MKAMQAFFKTIICVGIIFPALLISFSQEVLAGCVYYEEGPDENYPEDMCDSFTCSSPSGTCSSGYQSYSCDYYEELLGEWGCYWQYYSCDTACGGGGGGGGHTPIWNGWHDVYFGEQTSATCRASGWITDNYYGYPSDQDVPIRIYVDQDLDNPTLAVANEYRDGLGSYCTNGTCAFNVNLWDITKPDGTFPLRDGNEHNIWIYAGNFMLPAMDYTVNPPVERNVMQRKITCSPACTNVAPDQPVISTPTNGQQLRVGTPTTINWPDIASWGMACTNPSNHYEMCIKSNEPGTCDYVGDWDLGTTSQYSWTPSTADNSVWLYAGAHNGVPPTVWSNAVNVCVEGGVTSITYGACNPATQTKTLVSCSETCGNDDCAAEPLTIPACCATYPNAPTLVSPANGAEITYGTNVTMDWSDVTSWGYACPANDNHYKICVSTVSGSCNLENTRTDLTSQATRPAVINGNIYWSATANNGDLGSSSAIRNFCVEGFDIANTSYVSAWTPACGSQTRTCTQDCGGINNCSGVTLTNCQHCAPTIGEWGSCGADHKRTRTCTDNDGLCDGNDCASVVTSEDCIGTITGTLFDASDLSSCPADIGTNSLYSSLRYANANFDLNGPWPAISLPVGTDSNGNYSESVYASSNGIYSFDYTNDLISSGRASGIKTECGPAAATVTGQGQTVTKNTGFWRNYGGWWQVKGASVHAEGGITSRIPASLPSEQSLILPVTTPVNRWGFLSYGLALPQMLGSNPNAQVSTKLWEKLSSYQGLIYDWNFFHNRFNLFTYTAWNDTDPVIYNDQGLGYQIFRTGSSVTNFNFSPTGGQKAIFEIAGDVTISGDITVPSGAFLAIIAHGTITFDPAVTQSEGWYIGDLLSVPCRDIDGTPGCDKTDVQFAGNGSFIGWEGVEISRDLGGANNTAPSEIFTYRHDLSINAPPPLKIYSKYYKPFIP